MRRGLLLLVVGVLMAVIAADVVVVDGLVRLIVFVGVVLAVAGLGALAYRHQAFRFVALVVVLVALVVALTPVRTDGETLQRRMVEEARHFEGVAYVWGGESRAGIDCSGLPRSARRAAALALSVTNLDPALARAALLDWFFDVPAKGLLAGRGTTRVAEAARAGLLPRERLRPGDLVCTSDGTHVMMLLDDHHVIEADPLPGRVIVASMDDLANPWMTKPVVVVRFAAP